MIDKLKSNEPHYMDTAIDTDAAKDQLKRKGGVKIDTSKSMITNKIEEKKAFEEKAIAANQELIHKNSKAGQIATSFWEMIKNKEVAEKGPIAKNLEKETINNLINYAIELNNDPAQELNDMGSVSIIILLVKTVIYQRDILNKAQYDIFNLEKRLKELEKKGSAKSE